MTKSESEENSKIINEYYTQALIELELGCPMDDMYDSMMYYEEQEQYLICAGIKKALDEFEHTMLLEIIKLHEMDDEDEL